MKNPNKERDSNYREHLNVRDSYKLYRRKTPVDRISVKNYVKINNLYNQFLMEKVFDGHEIYLPLGLGTIKVVGKKVTIRFDEEGKPRGMVPDWVGTKKLWAKNQEAKNKKKLVYLTNEHSDGIRYRFHWSKQRVIPLFKAFYQLRLSRANKRTLNKLINKGREYHVLPKKKPYERYLNG